MTFSFISKDKMILNTQAVVHIYTANKYKK